MIKHTVLLYLIALARTGWICTQPSPAVQSKHMNHETWMKEAIKIAHQAEAAGGLPMGAVLVFENQIIAKNIGRVWADKDPSAHPERLCITQACQHLQTINLTDCTLYTTIEPCSMCLACAGWASLGKIVFGAFQEDVAGNQYELNDYHALEFGPRLVTLNGKGVRIIGGILRDECKALMAGITNWTPRS